MKPYLIALCILPLVGNAQEVYTLNTLPKHPNGLYICGANQSSTTPCQMFPRPIAGVATCPVEVRPGQVWFMPCPKGGAE